MKYLFYTVGSLGTALLALFAFSAVFANDLTDFERMLREAENRANQNNAATAQPTVPRVAAAPVRETQPVPGPGAPARTVTTSPIASSVAETAAPLADSGGWTTVEANDPNIVIPKEMLTPPPQVKPTAEEFSVGIFTVPDMLDAEEELHEELVPPTVLFEPDPIVPSTGRAPGSDADSLFIDSIFEMELEIIVIQDAQEDEIGILEPETRREILNIWELGAMISEPRRRDAPRGTIGTPPQRSDISDRLDEFADMPIVEGVIPADTPLVPDNTQVTVSIPYFDCEDDDTVWRVIDPSIVGDPNAQAKLRLKYEEVMNGLRMRNIENRYNMWRNFARGIMNDTAGINTRSELDGRWRLDWFLRLFLNPIYSVFEVEEYSRELFVGLSGGHRHLAELMPGIRKRMDVQAREAGPIRFPLCTTPMEALVEVKRCLLIASSAHARAFSTLTHAELKDLEDNLLEIFVRRTIGPDGRPASDDVITGHTVPRRSVGRRLVDIFARVDMAALYDAAEALIPITNTALLDLLADLPDDALPQVMIGGQRFQRLTTAAGDILISRRGGTNVFELDSPEFRNVICIIGRGDHDTYREGTSNLDRPVMVVIALGRQNTFTGIRPGIQGGSVMGVSMLLDRWGNSTYTARDVAQGSTVGGIGILINYEGGNSYTGVKRVQGHALLGLGMLIDRGRGDAFYKAAMWAQGFGAPGGFGVLSNSGNGNNHFYAGGLYIDSYPEHPGYDGWAQGVGAGLRQVANGGIGIILSGTGNDVYEVDYFGHGGGYWLGIGIARDFGGNDIRHGTTLTTYDGRPRPASGGRVNGVESRWTRFVNGWGCHYANGYLFDDGGDDVYSGNIMGTGMAWDLAYGILVDFNGSGRYTSTGNMKHGVGAQASIGILFSYGGNDVFSGRSMGTASPSHDYHPAASGGNFSFLINYGGNNQYGTGPANQRVAQPHSYVQRGSISGFLIDRPTESEAVAAQAALRRAIEERNHEIATFDERVAEMRADAARRRVQFRPPPRPQPIRETQLIGAVPDFDSNVRRADTNANVR